MRPTPEQQTAIDAYVTGDNLRIEALAGTGKTTTLSLLVRHGSPRRGKILYTSFGKKVIEDAKARFPSSVLVKTNHSLAWSVGKTFANTGRLVARVSPTDYISHFGWTGAAFAHTADPRSGAYAVIETLNAFVQSDDDDITTRHAYGAARRLARNDDALTQHVANALVHLAREAWAESVDANGSLPVVHDFYLKLWALRDPHIPATTILLDEAQDANGVMIGVLRKQAHAQLVVVGDRQQQIYGWRGAVDAMDAFTFQHHTTLTQSFRFGQEIAEVANAILTDQCGRDVELRGDPTQPGIVTPCQVPHCYLARTNAALIGQAFSLVERYPRYRIGVVGGVTDLIKLVEGAEQLKRFERTQVQDLAEFANWAEVQDAAQHAAYTHLRTLVQLVDEHGTAVMRSVLERMRGNETDPDACDVLLSTAHKAKGAEFDSVKLLDDFKPKGPPEDVGRFGWTPEEGNLLYVACTRARQHLDVSVCSAVLDSLPPDLRSVAMTPDYSESAQEEVDVDQPWEPEELTPPLLQEGVFDHPLVNGAVVRIQHFKPGTLVKVEVGDTTLSAAQGALRLYKQHAQWVDVMVGDAAWVAVPKEALTPT